MPAPILIVGGGLAGSWLAHELEALGLQVWVVERRLPGASSPVAAGLFHPAPGARWTPRPGHAARLAHARQRYLALEAGPSRRLWQERPLRRSLDGETGRERWRQRRTNPLLRDWVVAEDAEAVTFHGAGWVDVPAALAALAAPLHRAGRWLDTVLEDCELDLDRPGGIGWRGRDWAAVVLCRGWREAGALGGRDLPWRPARGELLRFRQEDCCPSRLGDPLGSILLGARGWRIPLGGGAWRAGASHGWQDLSLGPGRAATRRLVADLLAEGWAPTAVHAEAGVRPIQCADAVLAGPTPHHPRLWRFNSLGSHGTLLAPFHATRLAAALAGRVG